LPYNCEPPTFPASGEYRLIVTTDTVMECSATVNSRGFIGADSIVIRRGDYRKKARISGYMCRDGKFTLELSYYDTVDNSGMKIEGSASHSSFSGAVNYCPDKNTGNFTRIGSAVGAITMTSGWISIVTPLVTGTVDFMTKGVEYDKGN